MPSVVSFADDPINGTDEAPDRLGRQAYSAHLVTLLDRIHKQSESSVLALIGPWGGGKSSVLEMIMKRLAECADENRDAPAAMRWRVAEFNPWAFSDLDTMLLGFFDVIIAALPEEARPKDVRRHVGRFIAGISPIGKAAGLVGIDAQDALGQLGRWMAGDSSPSAEREKLVKVLRVAKQPTLMVLDDLDRLAPAELLLVFKLVRFVGRLPNVYYLLSYDERTLLDVLARTELCGGNPPRARDYLEKIVQVRLDLSPLHHTQASNLVNAGIDSLAEGLGVAITGAGRELFNRAYDHHLRERLTTPRSINRYLAQVDAFYTILGEEVNFFDFALLTFIRTFEPALYATLYRMRAELSVVTIEPLAKDGNDILTRWRSLLRLSGVADGHEDGLVGVLAELFQPIAAALKDRAGNADTVETLAYRKSIGHRDYFDRYFAFGVPDTTCPTIKFYRCSPS